ncbi:hypothetical protein Golax_003077, partial [Gossypium laxum]|nr:hypothetical protein [Gossypium laxum]
VKDIYDGGGYLVLVTTDRQSAFDRILASIPFKGQTSLWWFNRTQHITPDAVLSVPDKNVATAKKCSVFPIELVEEENVQATDLPLVNPYFTYQRPSFSPIKSIKSLISTNCKNVREYVQSSKFDKYLIYGVRLALNYHGTSRKSGVSRIALLDSRYKRYQDACIGTVEATLSSGMAMIQIIGAEMVESAITLTLHYQIVYRFQDHAFKLSNHNSEDSLLISVNTREEPHCVPVPKQIPKQELLKLFSEKWPFAISAYTTNLPNTVDDVTFSNWKSRIRACTMKLISLTRKNSYKKSTQFEFYKWWINGDPNISPLGEDNVKFVYLVDYSVDKLKKSSEAEQQSSSPPPPPKKDPQDQKK